MTQGILEKINAPNEWSWERLWRAAPRVQVIGQPDAEPLSVFLQAGVVPRSSRGDNHNQLGEDLSKYQVVQPGDLVFNKLRTWQGGLGVSNHHGIVSPAYFVCHPRSDWHPRYLHYLLLSAPYLAELTRLSKFMPPSQFDIPWESLRTLSLLHPPLDEQRRIADFLDAETARVDQLIAARRAQAVRLSELWDSRLAAVIDEQAQIHGWISLRRLVTSVEQGWSPQCDDAIAEPNEWAVLKTSAVSSGEFAPMEHKRLPADVEPDHRYQVRDGDILMTRGSGSPDHVGMAALAKTEKRQLLLSDLLYRIRLGRGWSPEFVTLALRSQPVRGLMGLLLRGQSGQTIKLRAEDVRSIDIPAVPAAFQSKIVTELSTERTTIRGAGQKIEASLSLLAERKQALITATVTGGVFV